MWSATARERERRREERRREEKRREEKRREVLGAKPDDMIAKNSLVPGGGVTMVTG